MFKLVQCIIILVIVAACSSAQRTKFSDKNMRVMINPEGLSEVEYMNIQNKLVELDSFTVIDRSRAIEAIKKEQSETHVENKDRYENSEKFSHWGKLYGVGSVIVAHSSCQNRPDSWNVTDLKNHCKLYISLVDSNTAEVIVSAKSEYKSEFMQQPDWDETIEKLVSLYPKYFNEHKIDKKLKEYKEESERLAKK